VRSAIISGNNHKMSKNSKSVYGARISAARPIYGIATNISEPCTYTIPPELDLNTYIARAMNTMSSITNATTKNVALIRLNNIEADIRTIVNK
jgi:hypothetical protein